MVSYIDLNYKPSNNDLITSYYVEISKSIDHRKVIEQIAAESSIGTWVKISTINRKRANKLKPHVFKIKKHKEGYLIDIAYHLDLFEMNSIPQLLSAIAGNIFGMKIIKNLRLEDIGFPRKFVANYKGPLKGIKGIRKLTRTKKRPLIGTIVKPKVGLSAKEHAIVAYNSWLGGLDLVKDDENLTSMKFNKFEDRMRYTFRMRDKAEQETGEKKLYMANITAPYEEMKRRAKIVKELGGEFVMIDILTTGFSALQSIRDYLEELGLGIHAHRAMHAALTRNTKHGISMMVIAKLARLIGVDTLHIGTAEIGKMHGEADEVLLLEREIEDKNIKIGKLILSKVLKTNWGHIKPVMAVASGGLCPLSLPKIIKIMGTDIIIQAGGGVHWHPKGPYYGARAMRQALEATMQGIKLEEYAKNHKELRDAIIRFSKRINKKTKRDYLTI